MPVYERRSFDSSLFTFHSSLFTVFVINNLSKTLGLQTRATHQGSVDVRLRHQPCDVVGLDRSPIKDPHFLCCLIRVPIRENAPDKRVHFLRLLRRRCTSSTDGPNRLVGNDDTVEVGGCQPIESAAKLAVNNAFGDPLFTLFQSFADAKNNVEMGGEGCTSFFVHHRIGLAIELAPLGMSNYHVSRPNVAKHCRRHFSSVRAFVALGRTVLTGNSDVGSFQPVGYCFQSSEDRSYD